MPIIDHSSKTDRFLNNAGPVLNQALGGLIQNEWIQQRRQDRQREEMNQLSLADRDFGFRQQQADRQQQNTDRVFEQRQQLIDRETGQADAAADYYRGKLQELYPGPSAGIDFSGLDAPTLRGILDTELYQREYHNELKQTQVVWEQALQEFGIDLQSPEAAQVQAMIDGADTLEEVRQARQMAYKVMGNAREQQFETQRRTRTAEMFQPLIDGITTSRLRAQATIFRQMYMNGEITGEKLGTAIGKLADEDSGGGERPTVERLAFGRGMDSAMSAFGSGSDSTLTREETEERIRTMAEMTGQPLPAGIKPRSAQASASPAPGGISPTALRTAASEVAKKSDRKQQMQTAYMQAQKIARDSGRDPSDEAVLAEIMRQIVPGASGSSSTGLQGNM